MKLVLAILISFTSIQFGFGQNQKTMEYDVSDDIVIPNHYIVTHCPKAPIIDGIANETCWSKAQYSSSFIDITGVGKPRFDSKVKMLWNKEYLYVYAEMEEPHVWGNLYQRDTIIYLNNDFEVFLDPSGKAETYGEIEINALGTEWDLLLNKPYRVGGFANFHWNLDSLKSAVHVYGTINNSKDIDSLWTVEMAIPMRPLIELKNKPKTTPKEGEQWRINFSRVEWQHDIVNGAYSRKKENGKVLREDNWVWSNQKVINMHEPEKWGVLQFTTDETSADVSYNINPDEETRQIAYALFRKIRWEKEKYEFTSVGETVNLEVAYSKDKKVKAQYLKTWEGFNIKITNTETGNSFVINQQGQFKQL